MKQERRGHEIWQQVWELREEDDDGFYWNIAVRGKCVRCGTNATAAIYSEFGEHWIDASCPECGFRQHYPVDPAASPMTEWDEVEVEALLNFNPDKEITIE